MKLSVLALALSCLSSCAAERAILNLASESAAKPRHKARVAKVPGSNPTSIHDKAPSSPCHSGTFRSRDLPECCNTPSAAGGLQDREPCGLCGAGAGNCPCNVPGLGRRSFIERSHYKLPCCGAGQNDHARQCHNEIASRSYRGASQNGPCYLRVLDGELEPVSGFRGYASLSVGEVVFTIGSPEGLINTLGDGLLSGLRRSEDGIEYVQITAPVSPGSSGGGVFDDRGNLIGISTFTIRDAQNLNFAIAASHFWR